MLGEGLQQGGSSLVKTVPGGKLQQVFLQARRTALDSAQPEAARVGAIQLLAWAPDAEAMSLLLGLIEPSESQALQMAAIKSLSRFGEPSVGGDLLKRWANLTPRLRAEALAAVLTRSERVPALLLGLEAGTVHRADLTSNQIDFLRKHRDPSLRQRAETILGATARSSRQEVVDKLLPALQLIGDSARGQKSYLQRCASCHRAGGQGQALGPDLAAVRAGGKEKLLVNILDPNREVAPNYLSYLVETKDGESLLGIIASETGASLTLRQTEGKETVVLRSNLMRLQSQGLSAMPEGLEAGLSAQDVADLLEFIVAPEPERK